jgi:two-component system nitrogen regulation response regulator GlnG
MPVLITGESGTGKELFARLLHEMGPSPTGPFVAVNCGALARELAESELFGHERGAFTGAASRRAGWFEEASGGTLVLDEIGELPREAQAKLLRVLETGRIRRVGGSGETAVQVRVVAATLRNLRQDAARGTFRLDLFHRLAGFELRLPPLRQRPSDIPVLAQRFLDDLAPEIGPRQLDRAALATLQMYSWPGNVRELRNVIVRAAHLSGPVISAEAIELEPLLDERPNAWRAADGDLDLVSPAPGPSDVLHLRGKTYDQVQAEVFLWHLRAQGNSRRKAAAALGISRSTFCDRVKRLGLRPDGAGDRAPTEGCASG